MKHIYTSVDIGSNSIKIVVFELYKNKLNLLAASSVKSEGIKKGVITNFDEASYSMIKGFKDIEQMLGIKINKVIASVPSYFADYIKVEDSIEISNEEKIVTGRDISNLLEKAVKPELTPNREMVTVIPIDFMVDGIEAVKDPKGLHGSVLSVRAILVTTPAKNIYSVVNLIENAGVEVVDISLNSIGDINTFRNESIDKCIGAVINIGSETTNITLYNKSIPVKSAILQLGGRNIENDIAYMYKVDSITANNLKEQFAVAHKKYASSSEYREVKDIYGNDKKITQLELSEVVMSRIEEILSMAKEQINDLTNKELRYIIITGGTSNIPQFKAVASEILGDISIGNIKIIGVRNNKYSSAIGNVIYFINRLKLRGNNYSMFNEDDEAKLSSRKNSNNSNESMLGKVFGYFFGE